MTIKTLIGSVGPNKTTITYTNKTLTITKTNPTTQTTITTTDIDLTELINTIGDITQQ